MEVYILCSKTLQNGPHSVSYCTSDGIDISVLTSRYYAYCTNGKQQMYSVFVNGLFVKSEPP